jgi:hypothetical protein
MLLMATNKPYLFPRFPGKYLLFLTDADGDSSSLEYRPRPVFRPTVRAKQSTTLMLLSIIDHQRKSRVRKTVTKCKHDTRNQDYLPKSSIHYYISPPSVTLSTLFANHGTATPLPAKGKRQ